MQLTFMHDYKNLASTSAIMRHKPQQSTADTGSGPLRKLAQLDAIILTAAASMTLATFVVAYWHPQWQLMPIITILIVLLCLMLAWVDARTPPRKQRQDSTEVHFTRHGAVCQVPNM